MKTVKIILAIAGGVAAIAACTSNTYEEVSAPVSANPTYQADVKNIINANCVSCHSESFGQTPYLETYDQVKNAVLSNGLLDEIAAPSGEGMPEAQRLPQSQIDAINLWAANGFLNQ
ncbi:hypothetical protein HYN59_16150 [Flavobacterium album]|uniref:Cytochrome c domain-containing protein n=1 Tax=Flavobacterium album TaxID=2175091 RepID=A0A2S1R1F4_9FLAO|nr:hypothetical protein [Flavobacterium album]AWH86543.1 hypothetical protein HYN59_16150 [Flavobacterium album]